MPKRVPYFHVYLGLMVVFASYAMGATMRVREARLHGQHPTGCNRRISRTPKVSVSKPETPVQSATWSPIVEKYAGGVCLLTGTVSYVDKTGKPFRYNRMEWEQRRGLIPDANGPVLEKIFSGTAFHIGNGVVLTHTDIFVPAGVLEGHGCLGVPPGWIRREDVREVFTDVQAYFPNQPDGFRMKPDGFRTVHGVPEFTFELNNADVPALQVQVSDDDRVPDAARHGDRVGEELLLLGYPDASRNGRLALTYFQTSIGWNEGHHFLFQPFSGPGAKGAGFPIFDTNGGVIGIRGQDKGDLDKVWIMSNSGGTPKGPFSGNLTVMGHTYGAHLLNRKTGETCLCEGSFVAEP